MLKQRVGCNIMQFEDMARVFIEKECEDYFLGIADLSIQKQYN